MRNILFICLLVSIWVGCTLKEETVSFDASLEITFSNDTVAFDTLLSESRSSTRRLTVYNRNQEAIQLNRILLGRGENSDYSIIINGKPATESFNERILGGDSILILVEVNVTPRDLNQPYLVKDSIVFEWNSNQEHVKLVTYAQDGNRFKVFEECNQVWTGSRPYIISDTLFVRPGCTLTMQPGTQVYFENDAIMVVQGTLTAIGDSSSHIVFRNTRFDGVFDQVPGQWKGIYFVEGTSENQIAYADIFNAEIGLRIGTPDDDDIPELQVSNTSIFNMSAAGVLAFTSDMEMENSLIYNCGIYLVGNFAGGNYSYEHCTFSNEGSRFIQEESVVQFTDNIIISADSTIVEDLTLNLVNNIIWGEGDNELLISNGGGADLTLSLLTNIIKTREEIENNFTSTDFNFPGFKDPSFFDFSLDTLAFAKDKGTDIGIPDDITGKSRDALPDIGAFERIEN